MPTIFFTGFPGFLGRQLLPRVLLRAPERTATCLVQAKFLEQAEAAVRELEASEPALAGRVRLVTGDLVAPDLGLGAEGESIASDTREIYHLAAVYDLSVPKDLAYRVNVDGTRHTLDFAERCASLERFQYVSTCYVSGRYHGFFGEEDLIRGQEFNNFYEETKHFAEVEVQRRMRSGIPTTIYRPAIVVGDHRTGATQKYDGPYFALRWLLKQPGPLALMPVVGDVHRVRFNVVPRDFVVDAITALSGMEESVGVTYQLADPRALSIDDMLRAMAVATDRRMLRVPLPVGVAIEALERVPGLYSLIGIPPSAVPYFDHPTVYGTENTQRDLAGTGIDVPRFDSYLPQLVDFVKRNPQIGSAAMV